MYSFFLLLYFSNKKERHTCLINKISRTANHVAFIMFLKFFFLRDKLFMKCWHLFFLPKSGCNIDFLPHLVIIAIGIIFVPTTALFETANTGAPHAPRAACAYIRLHVYTLYKTSPEHAFLASFVLVGDPPLPLSFSSSLLPRLSSMVPRLLHLSTINVPNFNFSLPWFSSCILPHP